MPTDLIYFSSIDWTHTWQRPQQIASRLARFGKVIYVNPLGLRTVGWKDVGRIARRAADRFTTRRDAQLPVTVYSPLLYLPFPHSRLATRLNGRHLRDSLKTWTARLGFDTPIIWAGTPSAAILQILKGLEYRALVYDCLDNFPLFHNDPFHIIEAEDQLTARADIVFATADELFTRMRGINPHTYLVPNAADYAHFAQAATARVAPADLAPIKKPILGYVGEIAQWFDLDLVYTLAQQHPEWSLVLIGLLHVNRAHPLFTLPNVHFLGRKPYADLPAYLSQVDVCIIPFRVNALTSAVSPVKLYEYLATGKPVVSTPLKEVMQYQNVVDVADRARFASAVQAALNESTANAAARQAVAQQNTWDMRVAKIMQILRETIGTNQ